MLSIHISAQTKVSGTVYDQDKQPVAFANVLFKNSSEGVISDFDGNFVLESEKNYSTIVVSFVGFETTELKLKTQTSTGLEIVLQTGFELDEVLIVKKPKKRLKKKENPAYKIMRGIWAYKKKNGLSLVEQYEYKKYSSTEIGLNNIDQKFLKKLLRADYDSVVSIIKQDKRNKKFFVPVYLREQIRSVYGDNTSKKTLELIQAEKDIGIQQDGFVFDRIKNSRNLMRNIFLFYSNKMVSLVCGKCHKICIKNSRQINSFKNVLLVN